MVARNRVVLSGTLGVSEVWSTSLHFMPDEAGSSLVEGSVDLNVWADEIALALDPLVVGFLGNGLSTTGALTRVDTYHYGATGPATGVGTAAVEGVTGTAAASNPYQTCGVFSLRTGLGGASNRGRSYWPAIGGAISAGLFTGISAGTPAAFVNLLAGIADAAATGEVGDVHSGIYSPTYDIMTRVTSVEFDTVPDIQRRRADALTGVRYSSGIV